MVKSFYYWSFIILMLLAFYILVPSSTQPPIKVAVLDSGINKNHPALKGKIVKSFNAINPTIETKDRFGHGTPIAGIILGVESKQEKNVLIYDVKVLDHNGNGTTRDVVKAIDWCIDEGVNIINISFGIQKHNPALEEGIKKAVSSGILIVAAAGNTFGLEVDFPARYHGVLSVTAVTDEFKKPALAPTGKIDFAAPGINITSTSEKGGYKNYSGTSFAAAYVTGFIAQLLVDEQHSNNFNEIYSLLMKESVDIGEKGFDPVFGNGLLILKR